MTQNIQPVSMGALLKDIQGRLQKLESYSPTTMRRIMPITTAANVALPNAGAFTDIEATRTPPFSFIRKTPVLIWPRMLPKTDGAGLANFMYVQGVIEDLNNNNAVVSTSPFGVRENGGMARQIALPWDDDIPAGTYTAVLQYYFDGTVTTGTAVRASIDVFLMAG